MNIYASYYLSHQCFFFLLFILGAQVGGGEAKIRKLFEKVSPFTNKINCTKFVLKYDIYIINCSERIQTVWNLIRGSLRGSKRIKKVKFLWHLENKCNWPTLFSNMCKIIKQMQYKSNIFLPISLQIIIRGPNGGLILVIVGAQGGKN